MYRIEFFDKVFIVNHQSEISVLINMCKKMCDEEDLLAAWTLLKMANSKGEEEEPIIKTTSNKRKPQDQLTSKRPKRAKKKQWKEVDLTSATPEMPAAMRERIAQMGGYGVRLVIQKQLYDTDLNKNHGRLSIPIKKLKYDNFATEDEAALLDRFEGKTKLGLDVMMVDPGLRESVMCLKKWLIGSNDVYCLVTHWNSFVERNGLKSGEVVQLWSFRKDGADVANQTHNPHHLCFAITTPSIDLFQ